MEWDECDEASSEPSPCTSTGNIEFREDLLACKLCDAEFHRQTHAQAVYNRNVPRHYNILLQHYKQHDQDFHPLFAHYYLKDQIDGKLPWYADPVYPGIKKSSRYGPLFFTSINDFRDWEFDCGDKLEKLIKEPFQTHIWFKVDDAADDIPKRKKKSIGKCKDLEESDRLAYFGIPPKILMELPDIDGRDMKRSRCSCGEKYPFFMSFVECFLYLCLHALGYHSKDQLVCSAARADLKSFEKSTGINVLKKLPKRKFLLLFDFACDERLFSPSLWAARQRCDGLSFYCILCFKFINEEQVMDLFKHLAEHRTERSRLIASRKIFCVDEEHIGSHITTKFQATMHPFMFIRSDKKFYCANPTDECVWKNKGTKESFAWLDSLIQEFSSFISLRTKMSLEKSYVTAASEQHCLRLDRSLLKSAFLRDDRLIPVPKIFDVKNTDQKQKKPYYTMCPMCCEIFAPRLSDDDMPKNHNCETYEF